MDHQIGRLIPFERRYRIDISWRTQIKGNLMAGSGLLTLWRRKNSQYQIHIIPLGALLGPLWDYSKKGASKRGLGCGQKPKTFWRMQNARKKNPQNRESQKPTPKGHFQFGGGRGHSRGRLYTPQKSGL